MPTLRQRRAGEIDPATQARIRAMLDLAFEGEFDDNDWAHTRGGIHVWSEDPGGVIVSHGAVVERTLLVANQPLRVAYVEAVATAPDRQGEGHGTSLMRRIGDLVRETYPLGVLSTGEHGFYARLGWEPWCGPSFAFTQEGRIEPTLEDDGGIMILRTPATPAELNPNAPLAADWRPGDVW